VPLRVNSFLAPKGCAQLQRIRGFTADISHHPFLRADAGNGLPRQVERLASTCTVLGLFSNWDCVLSEVQLRPGDTLLLYTDGITEATNDAGEEFGESRLIETLSAQAHLPVSSLLDALVTDVQNFSPTEQGDDITLVVSHCRS